MSHRFKVSLALSATFLAFGAGTARASDIIVKVPFEFVVRGHEMPAGMYRIERDSQGVVLIKGENGTHAAAFVLTSPATGHDPIGNAPALTFTKATQQDRKLAVVWESKDDGSAVTAN